MHSFLTLALAASALLKTAHSTTLAPQITNTNTNTIATATTVHPTVFDNCETTTIKPVGTGLPTFVRFCSDKGVCAVVEQQYVHYVTNSSSHSPTPTPVGRYCCDSPGACPELAHNSLSCIPSPKVTPQPIAAGPCCDTPGHCPEGAAVAASCPSVPKVTPHPVAAGPCCDTPGHCPEGAAVAASCPSVPRVTSYPVVEGACCDTPGNCPNGARVAASCPSVPKPTTSSCSGSYFNGACQCPCGAACSCPATSMATSTRPAVVAAY